MIEDHSIYSLRILDITCEVCENVRGNCFVCSNCLQQNMICALILPISSPLDIKKKFEDIFLFDSEILQKLHQLKLHKSWFKKIQLHSKKFSKKHSLVCKESIYKKKIN